MSHHKCRAIEVIGTGGTLQVGGRGSWAYLNSILIGTSAASAVVTVYNGPDATGVKAVEADASTVNRSNIDIDAHFKDGFFITVTGGAAKITVVYE